MGRYSYSYQTIVRYDECVTNHNFLLRCQPREDCGLTILDQSVDLFGQLNVSHTVDIFGNRVLYGVMDRPHDLFVVASRGEVECGEYRQSDPEPSPIYLASTSKTAASRQIVQFGEATAREGSALEQALSLSHQLYNHICYSAGVTSAESNASESFMMGQGVCQDFAHILISLARTRGIAARYVAGLVVGTGETHAWVEIYSDGYWYGVDPTHDRAVEQGYIKLAHGRDALDCSVSRGVHRGRASHTTEVVVVVK